MGTPLMRGMLSLITCIALAPAAFATPLDITIAPQPRITAESLHVHYTTDDQKLDVQGVAWSYISPTIDMDRFPDGTMIWDGILKICAFIDDMGNIIVNEDDELEITGWAATRTDTLLTGDLTAFGFPDSPPPGEVVMWEFLFEITGGELAEHFGGVGAEVGVKINDPSTTFDGSFDVDFWTDPTDTGTGDTGPPMVPEPNVAMLLGLGLAGVGLASRRRA